MVNGEFYSQKLAWFKRNERPEAVLLVADDPERIRIVAAWTSLTVRRKGKPNLFKGESESEVWEWLWGERGVLFCGAHG